MHVCVIQARRWRWRSVADCVDFVSFTGWSLVGQLVSTTQYGGCLACISSERPGGAGYLALRTQLVGLVQPKIPPSERHGVYPTILRGILHLVAECYLYRQQAPESPIMEGDFRIRPIPSPNG